MAETITLSEHTYHLLAEQAEEAIVQYLLLPHPYIEKVKMTSGWRAVIKGTRIPVSIIVGYTKAGETPEAIADGLQAVSLAAVYDALSYYHDHQVEIEAERAANTEESSQKYLREQLGDDGYKAISVY